MNEQIEKVVDGVTYEKNYLLPKCSHCVAFNEKGRLCESLVDNDCAFSYTFKIKEITKQPTWVTIEGDNGEVLRCTEEFREKLTNHPKVIEAFNAKHGYVKECKPSEPVQKASEAPQGVKTDTGKPRYTLIPPFALEQVAICLTEGLKTHPDKDNWKLVQNGKERFLDSLYRHWNQYQMGEVFDRDNPNVRNLAAIMVNAAFALEFEVNPELNGTKEKTND